MRTTSYPTVVNLKDLPLEGESFYFSKSSGELNDILKDLIEGHDYKVELHLKSLGNAFEITGKINTQMNLVCAHCGREMGFPIADQFTELIVVMSELPRASHSSHTGHQHEDGPYCHYSSHYQFDLGEFTHEHLAAAEPYTPYCGQADCEAFFKAATAHEENERPSSSSPFADLQNLVVKNAPQKGQRS